MIRNNIVRGCASVLCAIFLGYCSIALAQSGAQAPQKEQPGTKGGTSGRWEGRVDRANKADSTLSGRKVGSSLENTCAYDSSTKWVSQYHADKKINDIDASQIKEEDYVICKGTEEKAGVIRASVISKRLSHSE